MRGDPGLLARWAAERDELLGQILEVQDAVSAAERQRDALRATLEWVQQHDHSHDAQLARVVAEGLSGEGL